MAIPSPAAKSGHTIDIRQSFIKVVIAAGFNPKHIVRHKAVTHLIQAGIDLPTVKRISGHKKFAMVERYAHQNREHIQAAMDKFEKRLKIAQLGCWHTIT